MIDPPSPFAEPEEWRDFLTQMLALPQDDQEVRNMIRLARRVLDPSEDGFRVWLIDAPSPFAPTQEWRDFLQQMLGISDDDLAVREMVDRARDELAERGRHRLVRTQATRRCVAANSRRRG